MMWAPMKFIANIFGQVCTISLARRGRIVHVGNALQCENEASSRRRDATNRRAARARSEANLQTNEVF